MWKLLDQCHQTIWRRWSSEYLTTLQERSKWTRSIPNLRVNDMVVVVDNQSPPLAWRLGRILDVLPGPDGHVRVARVLTRFRSHCSARGQVSASADRHSRFCTSTASDYSYYIYRFYRYFCEPYVPTFLNIVNWMLLIITI